MGIIKKLLLGTSILTMSLLFGVNLFTQVKYERVDAAINIEGSYLTSETLDTIKGKQGVEVYIILHDKYEGLGVNESLYRATSNNGLSKFVITDIDEDGSIYLYSEDKSSYLVHSSSNYKLFEGNPTTPNAVKLNSDGQIYAEFNNKTHYMQYVSGSVKLTDVVYKNLNYFYNLYVVPVEEMSPTNQFGYALLNDLSCDNSGVTPPSKAMWENLKNKYTSLGFEEDAFKSVDANKDSPITISKALAKYDYIMSKYGSSEYENFLNRNIVPLNNIHVIDINNMNDNNDALMIFIIMSSLISIVTFIYMYNRKKKDR